MKKFVLLICFLLACNMLIHAENATKIFKANSFTRVAVIGSYNVYLEQSNSPYISIKGKQYIINRIKVSVKDGLLIVEMTKERDKKMRVKNEDLPTLTIPLNRVTDISLDGYTDVKSVSGLNFKHLTISLSGANKINLPIHCNLLVLEASSASYINLKGMCNNFTLIMNGAGMFDGFGFKTNSTNVVINGSGKVRMSVKDHLRGNIIGFGTLYYKGNPKLDITKSFGIIKQVP